jgi:hypothetical protein
MAKRGSKPKVLAGLQPLVASVPASHLRVAPEAKVLLKAGTKQGPGPGVAHICKVLIPHRIHGDGACTRVNEFLLPEVQQA